MSSKTNVHKVKKAMFVKKGNKSKLVSKARKRFFVMDDTTINYYEKEDMKTCKGNIYVQNINDVKSKGKELLLFTEYRTFTLIADNIQTSIEWAEAIEQRLKDTEAVRKVVKKAKNVIHRTKLIEAHSKELAEFVELLWLENEELREENEKMRKEIRDRTK